jgi:phosphoenolpyruvate carboxykinase (GTP)
MSGNALHSWIDKVADLLKPSELIWCTGTEEEYNNLLRLMVTNGTLIPLSKGRYLHRSHPTDVARTEKATYICGDDSEEVGPLNNFMSYEQAEEVLVRLLPNMYEGKPAYIVPYLMGPHGSPWSEYGVEITDSPYVAASMHIMTRIVPIHELEGKSVVKSIHASGNLDPQNKYVLHFPHNRTAIAGHFDLSKKTPILDASIISLNSAYGGNALLNKKCHALRIASVRANEEGWMAEHMLLLQLITPEGDSYFVAGAFPSASGKTNLAMIQLPEEYEKKGWKARLLGDDIIWIRPHNGRLYAINPENGFFGVAPGTNWRTNPNAMRTIDHDTIFTNVGLTPEGEPWWEGLEPQEDLVNWLGLPASLGDKIAHPNSRFTARLANYPHLSEHVDDPYGVPIDIMLFGGRRLDTIPLVYEPYNWEEGVLMAASMGVETTAAAEGEVGTVRRDPMAMRPFCGYNINDYIDHWLQIGKLVQPPKILYVNWFQKDKEGKYIWPGFGENIRILEWGIRRIKGCEATKTPLGYMPKFDDTIFLPKLFQLNPILWMKEWGKIREFLESIKNTSLMPLLDQVINRFLVAD